MPFQKWLNKRNNNSKSNRQAGTISAIINGNRQQQQQLQQHQHQPDLTEGRSNKIHSGEDVCIIYLTHGSPLETVLAILQSISENQTKVS